MLLIAAVEALLMTHSEHAYRPCLVIPVFIDRDKRVDFDDGKLTIEPQQFEGQIRDHTVFVEWGRNQGRLTVAASQPDRRYLALINGRWEMVADPSLATNISVDGDETYALWVGNCPFVIRGAHLALGEDPSSPAARLTRGSVRLQGVSTSRTESSVRASDRRIVESPKDLSCAGFWKTGFHGEICLMEDGWKPEIYRDFNPLFVYTVFGAKELFEMLALSMRSVIERSGCNADYLVISRPEDLPHLENVQRTFSNMSFAVELIAANTVREFASSRYRIAEMPHLRKYAPIIYLDNDIVCDCSVVHTLAAARFADRIWVVSENKIFDGKNQHGEELFKVDSVEKIKSDSTAFSSGLIFASDWESVARSFPLVLNAMGGWYQQFPKPFVLNDQPFAVYVFEKLGISDKTELSRVTRIVGHKNAADVEKRIGFAHFAGGPGRYGPKLPRMREYMSALADHAPVRTSLAIHRTVHSLECPICGSSDFKTARGRPLAYCRGCGSYERQRCMMLYMRKQSLLAKLKSVLHFAPEPAFVKLFSETPGCVYRCFDYNPKLYPLDSVRVEKLDLCGSLAAVDDYSIDLIVHNHILEHLPCPLDTVLGGLVRKLTPGGQMIFTVPVQAGESQEDLTELAADVRKARFGQSDHMRAFGMNTVRQDLRRVLGKDCFVPMESFCSEEEARRAAIPVAAEPCSNSIFVYKSD